MGERENHLVDHPLLTDRSADGSQVRVSRHLRDEVTAVKRQHLVPASAAGHDRDMIDIVVVGHGCHRGSGIPVRELTLEMPLPYIDQSLLFGRVCRVHVETSLGHSPVAV